MSLQIKLITSFLFLFISGITLVSQCDPNVAGSCCNLPILESSGTTENNLLSDVSMGTTVYDAYDEQSDRVDIYQSKNGIQTLVSSSNLISNSSPTIHNDHIVWQAREENMAIQLYQKQGGMISKVSISYSSARSPKFINGDLYFDGERTFSPTAYDLVKLENNVETIISPSNSKFIGAPKENNGAIYFDYIDTDNNEHIAKYENGTTSLVVSDVAGAIRSNAFLVDSKIVYKVLNFTNFAEEIWVSDNGTKTNLTQDNFVKIDVIEQTSNGVIWKEQLESSPFTRKIWTYDGITISQVNPPSGLSASQYFDQIGDISFYYNTTSRKFYKIENGIKTLLSNDSHRGPNRLQMEGSNLFYSADDSDFEDQVFSISCGSSCPDDITANVITETAYVANNSIISNGTIAENTQIVFSAGMEVTLLQNFNVQDMGQLSVFIQSCEEYNSN